MRIPGEHQIMHSSYPSVGPWCQTGLDSSSRPPADSVSPGGKLARFGLDTWNSTENCAPSPRLPGRSVPDSIKLGAWPTSASGWEVFRMILNPENYTNRSEVLARDGYDR